jgi:uncharacterized protein YgiM (DUF1202 family)
VEKKMYKIFVICLLVFIISCSNKGTQSDPANSGIDQYNNLLVENIETPIIEEKLDFLPNKMEIINTGEEKLQYFGTVYNSYINDDNVNLRLFPSINADVIQILDKNTKVIIIGVSKEIDTLDNYTGNWLNVMVEKQWGEEGWVFSKYVENGLITASKLEIIELPPKEERRAQRLIGMYQINDKKITITLYPHKLENQNFYTFVYNWSVNSFHYSNIPGSYAWYPDTNELKHITYIGTDMESAWSIFTDDFKYVLQDFGTGPGPRGLGVWRIEDSKKIFSGGYYRNINLQGNTINVVYVYSNWNISQNKLDNEIMNYAKEYKENNPATEEMVNYSKETGLGLVLIIVCELNLDTGIRKIITGQYIYTQ